MVVRLVWLIKLWVGLGRGLLLLGLFLRVWFLIVYYSFIDPLRFILSCSWYDTTKLNPDWSPYLSFNKFDVFSKFSRRIKKFKDFFFAEGGSLPVFHQGGIVPSTGPILAQKGETILPQGFQAGGLVTAPATAALRDTGAGLGEDIAGKIKSAIEEADRIIKGF